MDNLSLAITVGPRLDIIARGFEKPVRVVVSCRVDLLIPRIIWGALLLVPFIYSGIALTLELDATANPTPDPTVLYAIMGVAAFAAGLSVIVPRLLLVRALQAKFAVEIVPDPTDESLFRDMPKTIRQFEDPDQVRERTPPLWRTSFIISLVISESVAIYGFVLAFMGFGLPYWAPFMAVGFLLIAVRFPTERRILKQVEAVYDARMP